MSEKHVRSTAWPERILRALAATLCLLIVGWLAWLSLTQSAVTPGYWEVFSVQPDAVWQNLLALVLALLLGGGVLWLLLHKPSSALRNLRLLLGATCLLLVGLSLLFITQSRCLPGSDQLEVYTMARALASGDYAALQANSAEYYNNFPYQLGPAYAMATLFRLFGDSHLVIQYTNVICLLVCVLCLYRISRLLFPSLYATGALLLILLGCFPLWCYTAFVYNIFLGWAFLWPAMLCALHFFAGQQKRWLVLFALCSVLAVFLRSNNILFVIAAVLVLLCQTLHRHTPVRQAVTAVGFSVLLLTLCVLLPSLESRWLRFRSGIQVQDGAPSTAWIAMGLQESDLLGEGCPGWYSSYSSTIMEAVDPAAQSRADIATRLGEFAVNPTMGANFFTRKTLSQWCDPMYEAVIMNNLHPDDWQPDTAGWLARWVYAEGLDGSLWHWMNGWQFVLYAAATLWFGWALWRRKALPLWVLLPAILFLGYFFFQLLWEGKGRYCFDACLPLALYAAAGLAQAGRTFKEKARHLRPTA